MVGFLIIGKESLYAQIVLQTVMEAEEGGTKREYGFVRLPRTILSRVEGVYPSKGYTSSTEYIRAAVLKELAQDEVKP